MKNNFYIFQFPFLFCGGGNAGRVKIKNKNLFWTIILVLLIIVSCDQDAFRHLQNASTFFKLGMYDQALVELKTSNRFLKDTPEFQRSMYKYLMWGIIALKEGEQQKAISNFSQALELEPGEEQIRFILSSLYLQQKDFNKAINLFSEKKHLDVTYGAPDYLQGIKYYHAGKIGPAIKHFEKTLQTLNEEYISFSDNPSQKLVVEQLRLALYSMLGEGSTQIKNYPQAIKYYTRALEIVPQDIIIDAKLKIAMLLYQSERKPKNSGIYATLGYYYSILNHNERAILYYEKAISLYPQSAPAWFGLGTTYQNKLDYINAQKSFEKALSFAREPKLIAAIYLALGQIYTSYDKIEQASQILNKAQQLDPENISIKNDLIHTKLLENYAKNPDDTKNNIGLGNSYLERKNYQLALRHFNLAQKRERQNSEIFIGLGRTYYLQNNYDQALAAYKKGAELEPQNSKALFGIADVYMATEKFTLAINTIKKVLANDPENVLLHHKLGYLYFYAGQNSEAVKEFGYVKEHINNDQMISVLEKIIEVIS